MTLIREERPLPGSFDYLLEPGAPEMPEVTIPPPPRRTGTLWPDRHIKRKATTGEHTPPPTPPERPGRNSRVRVEIEIVQRRAPAKAKSGRWMLAALIWAVVICVLAAGLAHSQSRWQSYRQGFTTFSHSDQGDSATSYRQGFTTYTDINRADGSTQHCRSYKQGWQTFTECAE